MWRTSLAALAAALSLTGCTQMALQRDSVGTAQVVMHIHQQQVLDNLAMFVVDYNAFPSFAFPTQGSAQVADTGVAGATPALGRPTGSGGPFNFSALGFSFTAQRQATDAFTLAPVNDPRRLELMRCAYQRSVKLCGYGQESVTCPDCTASFNAFYTGDPNGNIPEKDTRGGVNSDCLKSDGCWFHVGPKKCVPKGCVAVGCYCGTYVWVLPDGRNELTKLTLAILDYATNSAPVHINKQVLYYVDEYGLPTTRELMVGTVGASISVDENSASLLFRPQGEQLRIQQLLRNRLTKIQEDLQKPNLKDSERTQLLKDEHGLQTKLDFLDQQLSVPGLKHEFEPQRSSAAVGGPLFINQTLQTLAPQPGPAMTP